MTWASYATLTPRVSTRVFWRRISEGYGGRPGRRAFPDAWARPRCCFPGATHGARPCAADTPGRRVGKSDCGGGPRARSRSGPSVDPQRRRPCSIRDFDTGEMLSSLQVGLRCFVVGYRGRPGCPGRSTVRSGTCQSRPLSTRLTQPRPLVVPSFQNRRGHPWLVSSQLWPKVLQMEPPETPRDFLVEHGASIEYVVWDTDSILRDVDTPEEYLGSRPKSSA